MKYILIISLLIFSLSSFSQRTVKVTSTLRQGVKNLKTTSGITATPTLHIWSSGTVTSSDTFPVVNADYYLSSWTGNDGFNGLTKLTPKRTLKSMDTLINASALATPTIAIEGGSSFAASEGDGIYLTRGNVSFVIYNRGQTGKYNFPVLKGSDIFTTGWTLTGSNTYYQDIPNTITISTGNYAWIYVIEVDTATERTTPYTARNYLRAAPSAAAVDTIPGSYFCTIQNPSASPTRIYVHTTNGASPNNHSTKRYEVVTRDRAINKGLTTFMGTKMNIKNLFALDYGEGTGGFASRTDSFHISNSIVMGNATHMGVYGSFSSVDSCAYLVGDGQIDGTAVVFYQVDGGGPTDVCTVSNSTFYNNVAVLYSHLSHGLGGGQNRARVNIWNTYAYGIYDYVLKTPNTIDTADINFLYTKNSHYICSGIEAPVSYLRNSIMDNGVSLLYNCTNTIVTNCLYRSVHIPSNGAVILAGQRMNIQNSIFHVKTDSALGNEAGRVLGNSDTSSRTIAKYNIFIAQCPTGKYVEFAHSNNFAGLGQSKDTFDYNVYILVSGNPIWKLDDASANGGDPSIFTLSNWQTKTGQDSHSILIDLRTGYPDGLKTIFVDPDNGNYNLTNTTEANQIRAVGAGMTSTISAWKTTPTREDIIYNVQHRIFTPVSSLLQ